MLSAYEYGRLYNAVAAADPKNTSLNHLTDLYQADELNAMKGLNYDLLDKYWETGVTMKHNVNLSGATDRASYLQVFLTSTRTVTSATLTTTAGTTVQE